MLSSLRQFKSSSARSLISVVRPCSSPVRCLSTKSQHDPLRVLFCGADDFSIYSLRALNKIRSNNPEKVESIDVVCRKDKRVGRGLKQIREVPIKKVAACELGLNVHQIDTFTGWTPPKPFNLVVAVSFGLLVPPRILNAAKYGGLNVHPSMLPDLRGPAPLHHTLLRRLSKTGVTLQTLHPKHFDHGMVVDQTPGPGLPIPGLETATIDSILAWIGPLGAEMLYSNLMSGSFAAPISWFDRSSKDQGSQEDDTTSDVFGQLTETAQYPRHASKILPEHRALSFQWPVDEIILRDRVLGRLFVPIISPLTPKRATFHGFKDTTRDFIELSGSKDTNTDHLHGEPLVFEHDTEKRIFIKAQGGYVSPSEITIEGKPKQEASNFHRLGVDVVPAK